MVIFTIILHLWGGKVWMDECQVVGSLSCQWPFHLNHHHHFVFGGNSMDDRWMDGWMDGFHIAV
jgi:hypothetical protein